MKKLEVTQDSTYGILKDQQNLPVSIRLSLFGNNIITYRNGDSEIGTCLNCVSHPCINYSKKELAIDVLSGMPHNNTTKVCPSDSIRVGIDGFPEIDPRSCFGCGVCLTRCGYAAINLGGDSKAYVNRQSTKTISWVRNHDESKERSRIEPFKKARIDIERKLLPKLYFARLYKALSENVKRENGFENLFVRNLLMNLGVPSKIRAVGNNDIRFDLLGLVDGVVIIGEIGLGKLDALEGPRAILDDIAVLNSRYKIPQKSIIPLVVVSGFPNKRSDVYEVMTDITKVLGIRISMVSIHFLIIMNLLRVRFKSTEEIQSLNVGMDSKSILRACGAIISGLDEVDPFLGQDFYQSVK